MQQFKYKITKLFRYSDLCTFSVTNNAGIAGIMKELRNLFETFQMDIPMIPQNTEINNAGNTDIITSNFYKIQQLIEKLSNAMQWHKCTTNKNQKCMMRITISVVLSM